MPWSEVDEAEAALELPWGARAGVECPWPCPSAWPQPLKLVERLLAAGVRLGLGASLSGGGPAFSTAGRLGAVGAGVDC